MLSMEALKAQIDVCDQIADALATMATSDPSAYILGYRAALEGRLKEIANAAA